MNNECTQIISEMIVELGSPSILEKFNLFNNYINSKGQIDNSNYLGHNFIGNINEISIDLCIT